jgi:hypothetical protein
MAEVTLQFHQQATKQANKQAKKQMEWLTN